MAMNNLFRTKTLASKAELELECMRAPLVAVSRQTDSAPACDTTYKYRGASEESGSSFLYTIRLTEPYARTGCRVWAKPARNSGERLVKRNPVMADPPRSEGTARVDEERLAHALISRGLLTRDEIQNCRPGTGDEAGPEAFLSRLVSAGLLTDNQAKRAAK